VKKKKKKKEKRNHPQDNLFIILSRNREILRSEESKVIAEQDQPSLANVEERR